MTNATKLTKGTPAYLFSVYRREESEVSVMKITIQSMGKKQGTYTVDGKPGLSRLYADRLGNVVAVADCADPIAEGVRRAEAHKVELIAHYQQRQTLWANSSKQFVDAMIAGEAFARASVPRADWYETLRAETTARVAAKYGI